MTAPAQRGRDPSIGSWREVAVGHERADLSTQHGAGSTGRGSSPRRVGSTASRVGTSWDAGAGCQHLAEPKCRLGQTAHRLRTACAHSRRGPGEPAAALRAPRAAGAGVPCQKAPQFQTPQGLARRSLRAVPQARQVHDNRCQGGVLAAERRNVRQIQIPVQEHRALRSAVHGYPPPPSAVCRSCEVPVRARGRPGSTPPPAASTPPLYAMCGRTREAASRVILERRASSANSRGGSWFRKRAPKARRGCGAAHLRSIVDPRCETRQGEMDRILPVWHFIRRRATGSGAAFPCLASRDSSTACEYL